MTERAVVGIAFVDLSADFFAAAGNADVGAAAGVDRFLHVFPFADRVANCMAVRLATAVLALAIAAFLGARYFVRGGRFGCGENFLHSERGEKNDEQKSLHGIDGLFVVFLSRLVAYFEIEPK